MKKRFFVEISVKEDDFCASDLKEAIEDGIDNVGNHTLIKCNVNGSEELED